MTRKGAEIVRNVHVEESEIGPSCRHIARHQYLDTGFGFVDNNSDWHSLVQCAGELRCCFDAPRLAHEQVNQV